MKDGRIRLVRRWRRQFDVGGRSGSEDMSEERSAQKINRAKKRSKQAVSEEQTYESQETIPLNHPQLACETPSGQEGYSFLLGQRREIEHRLDG